MGYASAISWILFALIFAVTIAQNLLQKRLDRSDG
jgi:multiple sugar transport system permease protein